MNATLSDKIRKAVQKEIVKRSLYQFFEEQKYDKDSLIYPPHLFLMPNRIPEIFNKVEVIPYVITHDPRINKADIGWNLFVLGTQRMDLGSTTHMNFQDLKTAMEGGFGQTRALSEATQTVDTVVEFIIKILENSDEGLKPMPAASALRIPQSPINKPSIGPLAGYYERNRFV